MRRSLRIFGLVLSLLAAASQARAQQLNLIRDAEIETDLREYVGPILIAAGLQPDDVHLYIVNDPALNAFVAGGQNIFVTTGLLMKAADANQVIGVLAHETGHIAGGHLARSYEAMANASTASLLALVLGAAAMVMGRGSAGNLGAAVMTGGMTVSQAAYLTHSREQEASADQAALKFLDRAHISARGMYEFMNVLNMEELRLSDRQDAYARTHPLTAERVDVVREHVEHSPYSNVPIPTKFSAAQERIRAKLHGFIDPPELTLNINPADDKSLAVRYARAVAFYRQGKVDPALQTVDSLIADYPDDPYFWEFRGQVLFEYGRIAESVKAYEKAVGFFPSNALLRTSLGQAQVESGDGKNAIINLDEAVRMEDENAVAWYLLSIAYGRGGDLGMAALAQAEQSLIVGNRPAASEYAVRAMHYLKPETPAYIRASDIKASIGDVKSPNEPGGRRRR